MRSAHILEFQNNWEIGILLLREELDANSTQREDLNFLLSKAAEAGKKLIIVSDEVGVVPKTLEMWTELAEKHLRDLEVHYLHSQLAMQLGYNDEWTSANPKSTYDLQPAAIAPVDTEYQGKSAW